MATMTAREAQALTNLTNLISSPQGSQSKIYPNEDTIVSSLQARARSDLPYTYVGSSTLVVVNPLRSLANASDASAKEYEKSFKEEESLQPHVYDLAGRVYLMMQQRRESQAVVYR
jgi:chitin synthase